MVAAASLDRLERAVRACLATGRRLVVVDVSRLEFFALRGMALVRQTAHCAAHDGVVVHLVASSPTSQRLLRRAGLDQELACFRTRAHALVLASLPLEVLVITAA